MEQLAIKGHATRGKEVIEILEMLGGKNKKELNGKDISLWYYIDVCSEICVQEHSFYSCSFFTLEEFLEKFPYKVGDKVLINDDINDVYTIKSMIWETSLNRVAYRIEAIDGIEDDYCWFADEMVRYLERKEETMENKGTLVGIDLTREESKAEEIEVILGDYEFVLKEGKTYFIKKKPQYPKTYDECCDVLKIPNDERYIEIDVPVGYNEILVPFTELIICRDAYWKIAGEQMGLGKPWEPDWKNYDVRKYCIATDKNIVGKYNRTTGNKVLAFPTEEMRDAFHENFKELINETKELL